MQTLLRKRFTDAIRNFIFDAEASGKLSPKTRARAFLEREDKLARLFLIEETERIMRHEERVAERPAPRENVYQMFLPGFAGLDEKLPLKKGKIELAKATVTSLEETLAVIRKKFAKRPDITRIETLIGEMRPYIDDNPGLTVERFCELKAAGIEAGAKARAVRV